ncbi:MAG: dihydrodipicolinate synthase family protein [Peptoniphilaceae bacterium]|nr:dihydrodipicolinate synthase family protein [Peptoniphilaceae bacterium]
MNTSLEKFEGVIPAFYACYDEDGNISPQRIKDLTNYYIKKKVKGLYVNGSSGECIYLNVQERKLVLENVMEVARGKLTVICHVACNSTRESMELAAHAQSLGVDAIAAIPPIYFKLPVWGIVDYWNDISKAANDTPFVIYNIPQLAGVALTPEIYKEMMKNPNVIGVKNSSMTVYDIQIFSEMGGDGRIVFNGPDEQFLAGRLMGAGAGIGGTYGAMVELYLKLNELIKENRLEDAKALQFDINRCIAKLLGFHANMYAVIKEVLRINEGIDVGSVRSPLTALKGEEKEKVKEVAEFIQNTINKYL